MNRGDSAPGGPLNSSRGDLERAARPQGSVALNMIEMVASAPFVVIPLVIKAMAVRQCLLAWAAGAVLALLDGLCVELGAAMPLAGGSYVFLREALRAWPHGPPDVLPLCLANADQAPLSLASGAIGFSQYASISIRSEHTDKKAVSGAPRNSSG